MSCRVASVHSSCVLLLLVTLLLAGCTSVGGAPDGPSFGSSRRSEQRSAQPGPGRAAPQPAAANTLSSALLSADDLGQLYLLVLETYVDRVDHTKLIDGAIRGVHQGAGRAGLLPMEAAIVDTTPLRPSPDPERDWLQFERSYDTLVTKLLRRVGMQDDLGESAAAGMLASLGDPQTRYVDRRTVEAQERRSYAGIGVTLTLASEGDRKRDRGTPIIREVFPSGPADRAGVRIGDAVVTVDDRQTSDATLVETVQSIRGIEGTDVRLELQSASDGAQRSAKVTRSAVDLPLVQLERKGNLQYVRVRTFQDGVTEQVRTALMRSLQDEASGVVMDLRGNTGGNLQEVMSTASLFVGDAAIGVRVGRSQDQVPIRSSGRALALGLPTILLVDQDTSSGAEVLAAAFRDREVAKLVGTRTAGRVGVASVVPLANGGAAQITSQRILSASGARLDGVGIEPDEVVASGVEDWIVGRDPQLDRAIAQLENRVAAGE